MAKTTLLNARLNSRYKEEVKRRPDLAPLLEALGPDKMTRLELPPF